MPIGLKELSWFSKLIFLLATINVVLLSTFFYGLSKLSEEALRASPHISFSFFVDYLIWLFLGILLFVYIHKNKYEFEYQFAQALQVEHESHKKIAGTLVCDVWPFVVSIGMLIRISYWIFFDSGPGA